MICPQVFWACSCLFPTIQKESLKSNVDIIFKIQFKIELLSACYLSGTDKYSPAFAYEESSLFKTWANIMSTCTFLLFCLNIKVNVKGLLMPLLGCLASRHRDIHWHKDNKSVSPTHHDTMIMAIMTLRKIRVATLGKVKPLVSVKLEALVKQPQQVTKQLPGYIICQPLLPAKILYLPPMSLTFKGESHIHITKATLAI